MRKITKTIDSQCLANCISSTYPEFLPQNGHNWPFCTIDSSEPQNTHLQKLLGYYALFQVKKPRLSWKGPVIPKSHWPPAVGGGVRTQSQVAVVAMEPSWPLVPAFKKGNSARKEQGEACYGLLEGLLPTVTSPLVFNGCLATWG